MHPIPESARYYKMANRDYLQWAHRFGFIATTEPIVLQLYSETLQKFRLAAQGHGALQPPDEHRERVATYFDPLPMWYEPFESSQNEEADQNDRDRAQRSESRTAITPPHPHAGEPMRLRGTAARIGERPTAEPLGRNEGWGEGVSASEAPSSGASRNLLPGEEGNSRFPLSAITQRPMFMYHAWGSQNAWLRQITARNWLYLHPDTGARYGIADEDWIEVSSHHGTITVQAKFVAQRSAGYGVDLERHRQAQGRVETRQQRTRSSRRASCSTI